MISIHTATRAAASLMALAASWPAAAQPVPVKPASAPAAWTVSSDEASGTVEIAATAKDGAVRFVIGCSRSAEPGLTGSITGYRGAGLRAGQIEQVLFYAGGEDWRDAFSVRLRYAPAARSWEFAAPLTPLFLSAFSRGAALSVVNGRNQEVFAFDLTGSTAATRTMRAVCGLAAD